MDIRVFHPGDKYDYFNETDGTPGYIQLVRPKTMELFKPADGTLSRDTAWADSVIPLTQPAARMYQGVIPSNLPLGEWHLLVYTGAGLVTDTRVGGELIIVSR